MTSKREQLAELQERVAGLESEIAELRRHHLRLAEIADVVQELLIPMASRDESRISEAIEKFQQSL
jgi:hypothetical protein